MRISTRASLTFLLLSSTLGSCAGSGGWGHTVHGEGPFVATIRSVDSFDSIQMAGAMQLDVRVGTKLRLVIHADENLQEIITTSVVDGVLKIEFEDSVNSQYELRAEIDVPALRSLAVAGSSRIDLSGLQEAAFELDIAGSARGTVEGQVTRLGIDIAGSGNLDCFALQAEDVSIQISGSGKVRTSAANSLDVNVAGSGEVLYRGEPSVNVQQAGSSRVEQDEF